MGRFLSRIPGKLAYLRTRTAAPVLEPGSSVGTSRYFFAGLLSLPSVCSVDSVVEICFALLMTTRPLHVLGMMSGTSADGIDAALVKISGAPPNLRITLVGHTKQSFPTAIRKEILRVAEQNPLRPGQLSQLHARLGRLYADAAVATCRKLRVSPRQIDLIGNHGQTIFHQGEAVNFLGAKTASTLQIGDPSVVAALTGITTVGDFRPADIALGGQGAPLVPFVDYLLWRDAKLGRVALNIGGIANLTVLPANARPSDVLAFDTGPGNMLIDALAARFTRGRWRFDKNARLALAGKLVPQLLRTLMRDPYFRQKPPKSTGREYFGAAYVEKLVSFGRRHHTKPSDLMRTATVFSALSIVDALERFVLPAVRINQLIVSGGGARNPLLLGQITALLPDVSVIPSSSLGVPVDAKEALAFALFAYETFHQRPSNLPSSTGASAPAILGKICYAPPR